jgi:hypothetical protein
MGPILIAETTACRRNPDYSESFRISAQISTGVTIAFSFSMQGRGGKDANHPVIEAAVDESRAGTSSTTLTHSPRERVDQGTRLARDGSCPGDR